MIPLRRKRESMTIYQQLIEAFGGQEGRFFTTKDIRDQLQQRYGTNASSVIPSDFCYNRLNRGIAFSKHLFEHTSHGTYVYRGPSYSYSGPVFARPRGSRHDQLVGQMIRGGYQPNVDHKS